MSRPAPSRRDLLFGLAFAAPPRRPAVPEGWLRYADPSTESEVYRITNPGDEAWLPPLPAKAIDRRSDIALFAERQGAAHNDKAPWHPWVLDLDKGGAHAIITPAAMDPHTLTLSADDRHALYFDGADLMRTSINGGRAQSIYRLRDGWSAQGPVAPSDDGTAIWFVEKKDGLSELRRIRSGKWAVDTLLANSGGIIDPAPNPRRGLIAFHDDAGALWFASQDGRRKEKLATQPGRVLELHWAPDGQSLFYLLEPEDRSQLVMIREREADGRGDQLVARTSQFAGFARNGDASVFVGASRNKASATVLLLLRKTRREFTLCEHRAQSPSLVHPRFTPNSQRVLFQTDRDGKPAIYMINVEKLVEKTEDEAEQAEREKKS